MAVPIELTQDLSIVEVLAARGRINATFDVAGRFPDQADKLMAEGDRELSELRERVLVAIAKGWTPDPIAVAEAALGWVELGGES